MFVPEFKTIAIQMLQTQTIQRETLDLLKQLMSMPILQSFALVGGTNLSLRFGHRLSVDLDLFTPQPFNVDATSQAILTAFPKTVIASQSEHMLFLYINEVKVDMVVLPYPYIEPLDVWDGVRLVSVPDIIAMKLSAVARRGVKKDFWDLAELLEMYSLAEMIAFYKAKYASNDIFHLVRALAYFEDAEKHKDPDPLKKMTWKQVKKKIQIAVKKYLERQQI
jgi:predicted nucleotidyltransferase component of viral defense system